MVLRLLIVDDNLHFLDVVRDHFEREGARVVGFATTSGEALRIAEQLRPDVVLVDIDLGEESGFDVAPRLHEAGYPVLLISAYAEVEFADLIAASPVVGFVSKSELSTRAITDLLARGVGGGAAAT
jgi:CheY-like chemotaxis protein